MGKAGQPVDEQALEAKRQRAIKLLEMGYSNALVARCTCMSKSWVGRVSQEHLGAKPKQPRVRI